jgi:AraC-like DNA-binding protein
MLLRRRPAAPLDAFVDELWASERPALAHARERGLPTGCADLVITLDREHIVRYADESDREGKRLRFGVLQGPHDHAVLRDTAHPSSVVGVHFRPGAACALLQLPLHELANRTIALDEAFGREAIELRERLQALPSASVRLRALERWLRRRLFAANRRWWPDPALHGALRAFDAQPALARVDAIRNTTGLSERRFNARFLAEVGLTPKRYARVRRFQAVLAAWADGAHRPWAQLALDAGYSDQPHLVHEFRRLSGVAPSRYRPTAPDALNHVAVPVATNLQDAEPSQS